MLHLHVLGQDYWSKPALKPSQLINYYKRTKPKLSKTPPLGACSIEKFTPMSHLCPTFPRGGGKVEVWCIRLWLYSSRIYTMKWHHQSIMAGPRSKITNNFSTLVYITQEHLRNQYQSFMISDHKICFKPEILFTAEGPLETEVTNVPQNCVRWFSSHTHHQDC